MANNFQTTVKNFQNNLKNNIIPVYDNIEFYNGDKEFATFSLFKQYLDSDHNKNIRYTNEYVESINNLLKLNLNRTDTKTYEADYNGLKLSIKIDYRPRNGFGDTNIEFSFTGKALKSKTNFKEFPSVVPGSVFHSSWGYNMTISEFYQVVRRSGNTVYFKKLKSKVVDGGEAGHNVPEINTFSSEKVYRCKLKGNDTNPSATIEQFQYATPWDGKPEYFNTVD